MSKNDQEANLQKYLEYVKTQGYDKLKPTDPKLDGNALLDALTKEGEIILQEEERARNKSTKAVSNVIDESKRLDAAFAERSTDPYIRARVEILKGMSPGMRKEIETMEATGDKENNTYKRFIQDLIALAESKYSA